MVHCYKTRNNGRQWRDNGRTMGWPAASPAKHGLTAARLQANQSPVLLHTVSSCPSIDHKIGYHLMRTQAWECLVLVLFFANSAKPKTQLSVSLILSFSQPPKHPSTHLTHFLMVRPQPILKLVSGTVSTQILKQANSCSQQTCK